MHTFSWGPFVVLCCVPQIAITACSAPRSRCGALLRTRGKLIWRDSQHLQHMDEALLTLWCSLTLSHEPAEVREQRVSLAMCFVVPMKHLAIRESPENRRPGDAWVPPWPKKTRPLFRDHKYYSALRNRVYYLAVAFNIAVFPRGKQCLGPLLSKYDRRRSTRPLTP